MKNLSFIAVGALMAVGVQAFAFTPAMNNYSLNVEGRQTINAQDSNGNDVVVIGGQAYPVTTNVIKAWQIQTQIFELQRQIASMGSDDCSSK